MRVRATKRGVYGSKVRIPGEEFVIAHPNQLGSWMEPLEPMPDVEVIAAVAPAPAPVDPLTADPPAPVDLPAPVALLTADLPAPVALLTADLPAPTGIAATVPTEPTAPAPNVPAGATTTYTDLTDEQLVRVGPEHVMLLSREQKRKRTMLLKAQQKD